MKLEKFEFAQDFLAWRNPVMSKFEVKNKAGTNRYKHSCITIWVNRDRYSRKCDKMNVEKM